MPREVKSQIIGVKKPEANGCKPGTGCNRPPYPGCSKSTEIEIMKNDIEKLKQASENSADNKSIELNGDEKLQVKGFDSAEEQTVLVKKSADEVSWSKLEIEGEEEPLEEGLICLNIKIKQLN